MSKNKAVPSVFLIFLERDGTITLLRRNNTGHMDGKLGLPSGKIEEGELPEEAAVREGLEEVGVVIQQNNLELVHLQYHSQTPNLGGDYVNFYFLVRHWVGKLINNEPGMCSELIKVNLNFNNLPLDMIPYVAKALPHCKSDTIVYSTHITRL